MSVVSVRLNKEERKMLNEYAKFHNKSLSTLMKESLMERIEDELDLKLIIEARAYNENNPEKYSHEEVKKKLGL